MAASLALVLGLTLVVLCGSAAWAHHRPEPAGGTGGLAIPALTHGEMAVVARHASTIRALADAQQRTDPTFRRLANFAALQRTYCLWGVMPGSLADEASPFNACLHSYLAALRALLTHMGEMPDGERARLLASRIAAEMVASAAAWDLCRNSAERFSTADVIVPEWRDVLGHPPSMLAFAGVAVLAAAGVWAVSGSGRRASPPPA
ncbi:hypothetical protein ABLE93_07210 [Xanthobacter sp. KR7-65]|uniref:hypothetical protein n=1 Tax=Xanthobacter sp. KR7-65 TaxID=3156612 RepID=UPI0032B39A86